MGSAPKIPVQEPIDWSKFPMPEPITFEMGGFEIPEMPAPPAPYDFAGAERKKEKARQDEQASVIARRERGRAGTVKTGPTGLSDDETMSPVHRPGLLAKY